MTKGKGGLLICFLISIILTLSFITKSSAQNINQIDFSTIQVDELTDPQIMQFVSQTKQAGYTLDQAYHIAELKGMNPDQEQKLKDRIAKLQNTTAINTSNNGSISSNDTTNIGSDSLKLMNSAFNNLQPKIFGESLFNNKNLSFEPNLNIPTPKNYRIGPGDELEIDIYGYSQADYKLTVSNEGAVSIPNVGLVYVNGLTIDDASAKIRSQLGEIYAGIKNGNTHVLISIGRIRSIKVTIIGEVNLPGTYTLPSLASVFNALYASGGPDNNGSMRRIHVVRNNKVIDTLDVYDFLLKGDQSDNIRLEDQDIIEVPPYNVNVEITGQVKRPGIYEILSDENFQNIINFAGGFTDNAYTASIKAVQKTSTQKSIRDISSADFDKYIPHAGDHYYVSKILDRFTNRISIEGAVYRPGQYQLTDSTTLKSLIKSAAGLRQDAFLSHGILTRLNPDMTSKVMQFNVAKILNGEAADIPLQREDVVTISSIFDLRNQYKVTISGAVRTPGTYAYADSMTVEDLIIQAGGYKEGANPQTIEVSRRVQESNSPKLANAPLAKIYNVSTDKNLGLNTSSFRLQPYDIVNVHMEPGYEVQKQVTVRGEVLNPGQYTLSNKSERISDLIKRAGGLTDLAYTSGTYLKRTYKSDRQLDYEKLQHLQLLQRTINDTAKVDTSLIGFSNNYVAIKLNKILSHPGGRQDLFLEDGDIITVPKTLQTVQITGEVLYPNTTTFMPDKSMKYYLSQSGGFTSEAKKGKTFVIYANGEARQTSHFLFFRNYPKVEPGSRIFVPHKPERKGLNPQQVVGLTSGLVSLTAVIITIVNLLK